jgi:hypothetical protein
MSLILAVKRLCILKGKKMEGDKKICGRCNFCIKDDGEPYCVCKDLYTTVGLDQECDETDLYGNLMFGEEKKNENNR